MNCSISIPVLLRRVQYNKAYGFSLPTSGNSLYFISVKVICFLMVTSYNRSCFQINRDLKVGKSIWMYFQDISVPCYNTNIQYGLQWKSGLRTRQLYFYWSKHNVPPAPPLLSKTDFQQMMAWNKGTFSPTPELNKTLHCSIMCTMKESKEPLPYHLTQSRMTNGPSCEDMGWLS